MTKNLEELSDGALQCRTFNHSWHPGQCIEERPGLFTLRLECRSCGTARIDQASRMGAVYGRQYVYPENYLNLGIRSRDDFRTEYLRRKAS